MASEIPVLFEGRENWVTGLTKRTTCDDVVYSVLFHSQGNTSPSEHLDINIQDYALWERWQNMERPLRGRTKVWKLWRSWGAEITNVRFILRLMNAENEERSGYFSNRHGKYHAKSRLHRREPDGMSSSSDDEGTDSDILRKESVLKRTPDNKQNCTDNKSSGETLAKLARIVVEQEKKMLQQKSRLQELDVQIDHYETKIHMARVNQFGSNYLQEAYLGDNITGHLADSSTESILPNLKPSDVGQYMSVCDSILDTENKIKETEEKIEDLSFQIFEESKSNITLENVSPIKCKESETFKEMSNLRKELRICLDTSGSRENDIQLINQSLTLIEEELISKHHLLHELSSELELCNTYADKEMNPHTTNRRFVSLSSCDAIRTSYKVRLKQSNPATCSTELPSVPVHGMTDCSNCSGQVPYGSSQIYIQDSEQTSMLNRSADDSDTGVSSLHSTSDDATPQLETLV